MNLKKKNRDELIQLKNEIEGMLNRPVLRTVEDVRKDLPFDVVVYSSEGDLGIDECVKSNQLVYTTEFLNKKEALSAIAYQKLCLIINDANSRSEVHKDWYFELSQGDVDMFSNEINNRTNPLPPTTVDIAQQMLESDYHLKLLKQYFMIG